MADAKLTDLTVIDDADISGEDLLYIVDDPAGVPESLKVTVSGLQTYFEDNMNISGEQVDSVRTKYIITPSVSSNNLTVAIKYIDGNDCTATNHIHFRVGDTEYDLTSSASYTKAAGTNWHNSGSAELAAKDVDYFVYAIGETGASAGLKFGHSRIPYATTMNDFVNTTTNERYIAGNWTNFNATDKVTNIGRFRATLSAGAGYTWTIPTAKVINHPIFETDFLIWQPTWGGWSANPTQDGTYSIKYDTLFFQSNPSATGTSNSTGAHTMTLPFQIYKTPFGAVPVIIDNGSISNGAGYWTPSSNPNATLQLNKAGSAAFTASGACACYLQGFGQLR